MSKRTQFWLGILISLLSLGALFLLLDMEQVLQSLRGTDWRGAILAMTICQLSFMALRAWRWRMILENKIRFWPLFHAQNIGYLVTNLLPFRLGDLVRSYLVGLEPEKSGVDMAKSLSTVALERVLDLLVIVLFFGAAIPLVPALPEGMGATGTLFSVAAVGAFVVMLLAAANRSRSLRLARRVLDRVERLDTESWLGWISSFLDGFTALTRWRLLLPLFALSLLLWLTILVGYYVGLWGIWPQVTWSAAALTVCAAAFGISLPSSPSALGVYHLAVVGGLSVFSLAENAAASFAFVYHAMMVLVNVTMGLIGLWQSGRSLGLVVNTVQDLSQA